MVTLQPANVLVSAGNPASFFTNATGDAPLTYQWQRNNVDIPGATGQSYTLPVTSVLDNGATFRVRVTNAVSSTNSNAGTLSVIVNQSPTAQIFTPVAGTTYVGGQIFSYNGIATDPETGTLPLDALTWTVDFYRDGQPCRLSPP